MFNSFTSSTTATLALSLAFGLGATGAEAATLSPSSVGVSTPSGSTDTSDPFTDDVLLDKLTFGTTEYKWGSGAFIVANRFEVLTGRSEINAEFGDNDNASDGDDNPFVKAGVSGLNQETTNPAIQDPALLAAFSSRSLSEITDTEGGRKSSFKTSFTNSLAFNDVGKDSLPDLVLFERGGNDVFAIALIIGGSFETPVYSDTVTINSRSFADAGFEINTKEIGGAQKMKVGGFDLADFGLVNGDSAFGFRLTTTGGPDLGGFFLKTADTPLGDPISAVPLPASVWFLLSALGASYGAARRRRAA